MLPNQQGKHYLGNNQPSSIKINAKVYPSLLDRSFLLNKKRSEDLVALKMELFEVFVSIVCLIVLICFKG